MNILRPAPGLARLGQSLKNPHPLDRGAPRRCRSRSASRSGQRSSYTEPSVPTPCAYPLVDHLEATFIEPAEKDRLACSHQGAQRSALGELEMLLGLLPYAVLFGLEKEWMELDVQYRSRLPGYVYEHPRRRRAGRRRPPHRGPADRRHQGHRRRRRHAQGRRRGRWHRGLPRQPRLPDWPRNAVPCLHRPPPAHTADVPGIQPARRAARWNVALLGKDRVVLYEAVQEFRVAVTDNGTIIGCGALHVMWRTCSARWRTLAVATWYGSARGRPRHPRAHPVRRRRARVEMQGSSASRSRRRSSAGTGSRRSRRASSLPRSSPSSPSRPMRVSRRSSSTSRASSRTRWATRMLKLLLMDLRASPSAAGGAPRLSSGTHPQISGQFPRP